MTLPRCTLTDLPRLLCGCVEHAEWAFDEDDLTYDEWLYLKGRLYLDDLPIVRRVEVVELPEYGSAMWTEPREVRAVTTGGNVCQVPGCTRIAGDSFVDPVCLDDLEVALGNTPALLQDLMVLMSREARVRTGTPTQRRVEHTRWDDTLRKGEGRQLASVGFTRTPHVARAGDQLHTLSAAVTTAVRALVDHRGIQLPPTVVDAASASRWLLTNLQALALDPAGPDIVHQVTTEARRAMRVIDTAPEGAYIGLCDGLHGCRAPMRAQLDEAEHVCSCGLRYDVDARLTALHERITSALLSIPQIAALSEVNPRNFGEKLTEDQLKGWLKRGRLIAAGHTQHPTKPMETMALYRAGDVLAIVEERQEREQRRSA